MANRKQSGVHPDADGWYKSFASYSRQNVGHDVQIDLALKIQLKRREHWHWDVDRKSYPQSYTMKIEPMVNFWLQRNKITYKKFKEKKKCPKLNRDVWEIYFLFQTKKDARRFVLTWL